jgi:hypothetical protein
LYPPTTITYIPVVQREKNDKIEQIFAEMLKYTVGEWIFFGTGLPRAQTEVGGGEGELDNAGAVVEKQRRFNVVVFVGGRDQNALRYRRWFRVESRIVLLEWKGKGCFGNL